jgi:aryl-alcohol dehydrogenase-like predicted oxidoreductase
MLYRTLPGTDLSLSAVGMGCWAMGGLWWGDDIRDEDSSAAVQAALDGGINWFDTAPLYGHGHADEVLVKALGSRRNEVTIATKVGVRWDGEGAHARSDLQPAWIVADVEASLQRLGLEQLDLVQIHWPCEQDTPLADSLGALQQLQTQGKIRYFGVCNYDAQGLREIRALAPIANLQTPYSMLRREPEAELLPLTRHWQTGAAAEQTLAPELGVLAYEPLCRGLLTGKFTALSRFPESDLRARDDRFTGNRYLRALTVVSRLQLVAKRLHVPVAAIALGWVLRQPGVTCAIAGAKRPAQIREHLQAIALVERDDIWPEVDRIVASFHG